MKDWKEISKTSKAIIITGSVITISGITVGCMILGKKFISRKVADGVAKELLEISNKNFTEGVRLGSDAAKHWYAIGKSSGVKELMSLLESMDFTDPKILKILKDKGLYAILDIAVRSRRFKL